MPLADRRGSRLNCGAAVHECGQFDLWIFFVLFATLRMVAQTHKYALCSVFF